ncbi:TniB family NTP-binding protein [Falsirhodobacter deserti]|uniref:TniB family NTP-binding protein n=1 Tax=Falsirhodobacter deserti TaxID=1365611 RepID=UPI000FE32CEC|nr:TniB family NTP-binding protein [Falsirhodobacter deserti]
MTKPDTTNIAAAPAAQDLQGRIAWLEARYLKNARDDDFQEYLRDILQVGPDGALLPAATRDPLNGETRGMQVIGASGDGKSVMIRRNLSALPGFVEMKGGAPGNYIHITVSPEATIKSLASDIVAATGYGRLAERTKTHEGWAVVRHRLKMLGIAMLWIDEAHHLLRGGSGRDVSGALQALKNLLQGEGAVAVILSGVPQLEDRIATDPETFRRYRLRQRLVSVAAGGADMQRIGRFIDACCRKLELALPEDPTFAERIVFAQKGGLGRSIAFAKMTVRRALVNGRTSVTFEDARRTWILNGGNEGEPTPFDPGHWPEIRAYLKDRGW